MDKKKVQLSTLGNQHIADHLAHFYPFLREKSFRVITEKERKSRKVFAELFPGENYNEKKEWLNALYQYQQCDTKTRAVSITKSTETSQPE